MALLKKEDNSFHKKNWKNEAFQDNQQMQLMLSDDINFLTKFTKEKINNNFEKDEIVKLKVFVNKDKSIAKELAFTKSLKYFNNYLNKLISQNDDDDRSRNMKKEEVQKLKNVLLPELQSTYLMLNELQRKRQIILREIENGKIKAVNAPLIPYTFLIPIGVSLLVGFTPVIFTYVSSLTSIYQLSSYDLLSELFVHRESIINTFNNYNYSITAGIGFVNTLHQHGYNWKSLKNATYRAVVEIFIVEGISLVFGIGGKYLWNMMKLQGTLNTYGFFTSQVVVKSVGYVIGTAAKNVYFYEEIKGEQAARVEAEKITESANQKKKMDRYIALLKDKTYAEAVEHIHSITQKMERKENFMKFVGILSKITAIASPIALSSYFLWSKFETVLDLVELNQHDIFQVTNVLQVQKMFSTLWRSKFNTLLYYGFYKVAFNRVTAVFLTNLTVPFIYSILREIPVIKILSNMFFVIYFLIKFPFSAIIKMSEKYFGDSSPFIYSNRKIRLFMNMMHSKLAGFLDRRVLFKYMYTKVFTFLFDNTVGNFISKMWKQVTIRMILENMAYYSTTTLLRSISLTMYSDPIGYADYLNGIDFNSIYNTFFGPAPEKSPLFTDELFKTLNVKPMSPYTSNFTPISQYINLPNLQPMSTPPKLYEAPPPPLPEKSQKTSTEPISHQETSTEPAPPSIPSLPSSQKSIQKSKSIDFTKIESNKKALNDFEQSVLKDEVEYSKLMKEIRKFVRSNEETTPLENKIKNLARETNKQHTDVINKFNNLPSLTTYKEISQRDKVNDANNIGTAEQYIKDDNRKNDELMSTFNSNVKEQGKIMKQHENVRNLEYMSSKLNQQYSTLMNNLNKYLNSDESCSQLCVYDVPDQYPAQEKLYLLMQKANPFTKDHIDELQCLVQDVKREYDHIQEDMNNNINIEKEKLNNIPSTDKEPLKILLTQTESKRKLLTSAFDQFIDGRREILDNALTGKQTSTTPVSIEDSKRKLKNFENNVQKDETEYSKFMNEFHNYDDVASIKSLASQSILQHTNVVNEFQNLPFLDSTSSNENISPDDLIDDTNNIVKSERLIKSDQRKQYRLMTSFGNIDDAKITQHQENIRNLENMSYKLQQQYSSFMNNFDKFLQTKHCAINEEPHYVEGITPVRNSLQLLMEQKPLSNDNIGEFIDLSKKVKEEYAHVQDDLNNKINFEKEKLKSPKEKIETLLRKSEHERELLTISFQEFIDKREEILNKMLKKKLDDEAKINQRKEEMRKMEEDNRRRVEEKREEKERKRHEKERKRREEEERKQEQEERNKREEEERKKKEESIVKPPTHLDLLYAKTLPFSPKNEEEAIKMNNIYKDYIEKQNDLKELLTEQIDIKSKMNYLEYVVDAIPNYDSDQDTLNESISYLKYNMMNLESSMSDIYHGLLYENLNIDQVNQSIDTLQSYLNEFSKDKLIHNYHELLGRASTDEMANKYNDIIQNLNEFQKELYQNAEFRSLVDSYTFIKDALKILSQIVTVSQVKTKDLQKKQEQLQRLKLELAKLKAQKNMNDAGQVIGKAKDSAEGVEKDIREKYDIYKPYEGIELMINVFIGSNVLEIFFGSLASGDLLLGIYTTLFTCYTAYNWYNEENED